MPRHDIFVGILVTAVTVLLHNLALAVLIGAVTFALVFAWESGKDQGEEIHRQPRREAL